MRIFKEHVERLKAAAKSSYLNGRWRLSLSTPGQLRGIDLIVAVTCATGLGDLSRFDNPRQLMGYLGLTPSERSTGDTVRRGGITKAGNGRVRHLLIESAPDTTAIRHGSAKREDYKIEAAPPRIREIASKARTRLTARYRALGARRKKTTVICAAIARELVGFMWCVAKETQSGAGEHHET